MPHLKKIDRKLYFLEFESEIKNEAIRKKENFKAAGFMARVLPTQYNGKKRFSVYVSHLPSEYNKNKVQ